MKPALSSPAIVWGYLALTGISTSFPTTSINSSVTSQEYLSIDTFRNPDSNDLGFWHGAGGDIPVEYGASYVRFFPSDPDHVYHTVLSGEGSCCSLRLYKENKSFLHIVFSGTDRFSVTLNQHNQDCDSGRNPYPETWDSVEARRYIHADNDYSITCEGYDRGERKRRVYIPLDHFNIDHELAASISFHGFYSSVDTAAGHHQMQTFTLYEVSIVNAKDVPVDFNTPSKLATGKMILHCSRPNSFAFGIDDGDPRLAQEVMSILKEEDVLVTFFVVGAGLRDPETNFSNVYTEMKNRGHQIALHSWSHPKLEALKTIDEIDSEITKSIQSLKDTLGIESHYFRPPFGTVGSRTRQRLSSLLGNAYIINWSVDIEDWIWSGTDTPEKQLEAFIRDVESGGNLAVLHYLSPSTIRYFRDAIRFVKNKGLDIMRVDQCLEDPGTRAVD